MLLTTIAMLAIGQTAPLVCPVMGSPVAEKGGEILTYKGVKFTTCCAGCGSRFQADPDKYIKTQADAKRTVGIFLFDPTTGLKIDAAKAKASSDFGGLRYFFASENGKKSFDANPKKFATQPEKEALFCPVAKEEVKGYEKASGYGDFKGVRYYFCCGGCEKPFKADPAKYAPNAATAVKAPKVAMDTK